MNTQRQFLQQTLISSQSHHQQSHPSQLISKQTNLFSKIFFIDIYQLLNNSNQHINIPQKIPNLDQQDKIQNTYDLVQKRYDSKQQKKSLLSIYIDSFFLKIMRVVLITIINSGLKMYAPLLCAQIIQFIENRQNRQASEGILLLVTAILLIFFRNLSQSQLNFQLNKIGINISSSLSLMIYKKSFKFPHLRQKQFSTSDIINYNQTDCEKISNIGNHFSALISTPLQIILGITIMWSYIGLSFFSGFAMTIVMIFANLMVSKLSIKFNKEVLKAKDKRMKITQEVLQNIRFIKINGFQSLFSKKINQEREKQLIFYKKKAWCEAFGYFLYWLTGPIILFASFTTYIYMDKIITSQAAFTTIMIFSILQYPIRQLPSSISQIFQIMTSFKRIEKFLSAKELKYKNIIHNELPYDENSISVIQGNFYWKKQDEQNGIKQVNVLKILKDININIKRNKLTMIYGQIGSGKSSLLLAILNQMKCKKDSKIIINGKISYCNQMPWILSTTIKKNIILYNQFNQYRYQKAIEYSGLIHDIPLLPKGDMTQVGEKGINISGGQKARIGLARALYFDSDIILLDDVISSLDVDIANFILKQTIKKYLKQKTVILVTHNINYAKLADDIILMKKGRIIKKGKSQSIISSKKFNQLCRRQQSLKIYNIQQKINDEIQLIKLAISNKQKTSSKDENMKIIQQLMIPQQQQNGQVKLTIFKRYVTYNGGFKFVLIIIVSMICWIFSLTFANIFMSIWCSDPSNYNNGLFVYAGFSLSSAIFILIRASILIVSGVKQGQKVHALMIYSLLKASLIKFYSRIPIGRIINRLSNDLRQLDQAIGPAIGGLLVCFFQMIGTLAICVYTTTPYLVIPAIVVLILCWKMKNYYLKTQREVVRLEKIANSPIVNDFISTLRGLESVRAYKIQQKMMQKQRENVENYKKIRLIKSKLEGWFALNLTYLSFLVNIIAISYSIISESTSPSIAGLLITYALNLSSDINLTILCYAYFQTKVISLERIYEFTNIEPQQKSKQNNIQLQIKGTISFIDTYVKYREDLPFILEGINLKIEKGCKLGIAGRSGSGKSTIINTLLKVATVSKGHVFLDGISLNNISIQTLRKSITVIDQDPFIIKGSLKDNIDIDNKFSDDQIHKILRQCQFSQKIQAIGGINSQIQRQTLSVGERQIICICRAILKKSKIILIDQATSHIDERNDQFMQRIMKVRFIDETVITIAHRLQTLASSDQILILDEGKVIQYGTSDQLMKRQKVYYSMVRANNIYI